MNKYLGAAGWIVAVVELGFILWLSAELNCEGGDRSEMRSLSTLLVSAMREKPSFFQATQDLTRRDLENKRLSNLLIDRGLIRKGEFPTLTRDWMSTRGLPYQVLIDANEDGTIAFPPSAGSFSIVGKTGMVAVYTVIQEGDLSVVTLAISPQ